VRKVLLFVLVTYAISWTFWLPMLATGERRLLLILGTFGPAAAALIVTARESGRRGVRRLLSGLRIWRVGARWYLFSLLSPAVLVLAAIGVHVLLGGDRPAFEDPARLWLIVVVFLYVLLFSVAGEETGWRGYMLPRLLERSAALAASLVIGVVWGLWHLPLFWIEGNLHDDLPLSLFLLQDLGLAVLFTWLWLHTGGSLLMAHLFHAAVNTSLGALPILPADTGGDLRPLWIAVALLLALAAVTTLREGASLHAAEPRPGSSSREGA
jgi:uncharacterized protein